MRPWTASSWSGCRRRSGHRGGRGRRIWKTGGGFAGSPVRNGVSLGAEGMFSPLPGWCRKWQENNPANRSGFWNGQVNQFKIGVGVNPILVGLEGVGLAKDLGQAGYLRKCEDVLGRKYPKGNFWLVEKMKDIRE